MSNLRFEENSLDAALPDIVIKLVTMPVTLEGETLGEKRRHYNKLVEDAIADKHCELRNISADDSDIDNLLKIDIASKTRNVDYIIEVMKSNDMLYAATAIKTSTWLINEQQYAHIINPEYLHTQLLPSMNTKTFNKLMLHIRLNLKDEIRVESFYEYLKETNGAYKWLQNCSIPFVENVLKNGRLIPLSLYKRLCKRSANFLAYYGSVESQYMYDVKQVILLFLKSHTTEVLNLVVDKTKLEYVPRMGKKKTKFLMKKCTARVLDNFDKYMDTIDLSTVAKYIKKNEIKAFLYKHGSVLEESCSFDRNTFINFIKNIPTEERLEFTKSTFFDKTNMALIFSENERSIDRYVNTYQWYELAPFDVASPEMKTLIRRENSSSEKCAMLSVLITCTQNKLQHIKTLLIFYNKELINEPLTFKIQFVDNLLSQIPTHEFDVETWNILDQLFHSINVYTKPNYDVQKCLKSIVIYKVLHDEPIPEIIEQNMIFNSFVHGQSKLNQEQNNKLFTYLFNFILSKIQSKDITNESDAKDNLLHLENAVRLLRDWNKNICEFPIILEEIQKFIQIVHQNMWQTNMSYLYNIKKSWRKHMFEESLSLSLCEAVCLNALKHKPQLLTRHDKELDTLRTNDAVSLRRLLTKLRVYWPHSLAQHWTDAYLHKLHTGQKAVLKGLFMLLSQNQIVDLAKKHTPNNFEITLGETDQSELQIRKNIAKNLYVARPLIPLDVVLWYAKGDYLQYAVPSLNAVLYYMSEVESLEHLPKLLDGSVSLQKFGLHLTFSKLKCDVLKSVFSKIWKTTKNRTIRSVIFKHIVDKIFTVRNPTVEKELWDLLRTFMNELTSSESAEIYRKIREVENVPISIRGEYFKNNYEFFNSLPDSANCKNIVEELVKSAPKIVESLDEDFIANKLLSQGEHKLCLFRSEFIEVLAYYAILGENEEEQLHKFRRVVGPVIEEAFQCWDKYYVRDNFDKFLTRLVWAFITKFTINKIPIPAKLFLEIKTKIEQNLPLLENYVLYTSWKLVTEYVKIIQAHPTFMKALEVTTWELPTWTETDFCRNRWMLSGVGDAWKNINSKIAPLLGPVIVKCLKEDIEQYSSTIFCLFAEGLDTMFCKIDFNHNLFVTLFGLETLKYMLNDEDFIYNYLVVSKLIRKYYYFDKLKSIRSEICKKLKSHQSEVVQLHYNNDLLTHNDKSKI